MAIKGKSKARTKRAVTRGPKPVPVEVKPPIFGRRWFQIAAAFVGGMLAIVLLVSVRDGLTRERRRNDARRLLAREQAVVNEYRSIVDNALLAVGQATPPSGFNVLPALQTNLDGLQKGTVSAKHALAGAKGSAESAKTASKGIDGFDLLGAIRGKGFSLALTNYLLNSKSRMVDGLNLFQQVALALEQAAKSPPSERGHLIASAGGVLSVAKLVFSDGYSDYVQAQSIARLFAPTLPGQAPPPLPQPSPSAATKSPKPGRSPGAYPSASPTA